MYRHKQTWTNTPNRLDFRTLRLEMPFLEALFILRLWWHGHLQGWGAKHSTWEQLANPSGARYQCWGSSEDSSWGYFQICWISLNFVFLSKIIIFTLKTLKKRPKHNPNLWSLWYLSYSSIRLWDRDKNSSISGIRLGRFSASVDAPAAAGQDGSQSWLQNPKRWGRLRWKHIAVYNNIYIYICVCIYIYILQ